MFPSQQIQFSLGYFIVIPAKAGIQGGRASTPTRGPPLARNDKVGWLSSNSTCVWLVTSGSFQGLLEGVDNAEAGFLEIDAVSRDHHQVVDQCRGGDKAVFDGHGAPGGTKTREQLRPPQARLRLPRQTANPLDARVEPPLEAGTPPSVAQQENAEAQLAEDDRIYGDFTFVVAQPLDHFGIGKLLGRLAEDVGVDQVSHNVSVDSDSTGTKKPVSGQASSQSTTPSFGASERRLSRYSPRSRRSMSNSWPGSIRSCCRISAGRTIWPFDDMVVFIGCKIASYVATSRNTGLSRRQDAPTQRPVGS